jgi:hypothetical protein
VVGVQPAMTGVAPFAGFQYFHHPRILAALPALRKYHVSCLMIT